MRNRSREEGRLEQKGKRALACLLLLLLLLPWASGALAAGTTVTVEVPETLPDVGESFTVTVSIAGNPGLCAAQYTLVFDKRVVSCEEVRIGEVLSGTLYAVNENASAGAIVAAVTTEGKTGDGALSTYTFTVLSAGDPAFAISDTEFTDTFDKPVAVRFGTSVAQAPAKTEAEPEVTPPETGEPEEPAQRPADTPSAPTGGNGGTAMANEPAEEPSQIPADVPTAAAGESGSSAQAAGEAEYGTVELHETKSFSDVPESFWGYSYIQRAAELGLVSGNPDGTFAPNKPMTRAEFVTILHRLSGDTETPADHDFSDVAEGDWFRDSVNWAAAKGYAVGDGVSFRPSGSITRQEVVTILFRYDGGTSGMEGLLAAFGVDNMAEFTDAGKVSDWAEDAMHWAIFNGLVKGKTATELAPLDTASRAEITTIFVRYAEKFLD